MTPISSRQQFQEVDSQGDQSTPLQSHCPDSVKRRQICSKAWFLATCFTLMSPTATALSPEEAATAYDEYAHCYDDLDGGTASSLLGIEEARSALFRQARGNVLEVGSGTGLNLLKFDYSKITSLTLLDISEGMLKEAKKRVDYLGIAEKIPVRFVKADATSELLDQFGQATFDTVVDSFSLCVMGEEGAKRCLDQMAKVVKSKGDGGKVLLLENSRSSNPFLGLYQDATANAAAKAGGKGCVYNQDVRELIRNTNRVQIEREDLFAAGIFRSYECVVE